VAGEQGIGKSALLREGLSAAEPAGCFVGWGAGNELEQRFPLRLMATCLGEDGRLAVAAGWEAGVNGLGAGWRSVGAPRLAGSGPMLAEQMLADQASAGSALRSDPVLAGMDRLLSLVERLCAVSPVVIVSEDLQWADEASLLVWQRLSRMVRQLPLLVVGSCRPVPARAEMERLRWGVAARGADVAALGPLPPSEVSQLVHGLLGAPPGRRLAWVVGQAGGNPLYVRELVDALVREGRVRVDGRAAEMVGEPGGFRLPLSLAAAIGERLSVLSAEAVGVLRRAAALGQEFTVTDLAVVTGWSAGDLVGVIEQALAAGVAVEAGPRLGFRHGLIRQSLYEGIPAALRVRLHQQAARNLAEAGASVEGVAAQLLAAQQVAEEEMPEEVAGGWVTEWVTEWLVQAVPGLIYRAPRVAAQLLRAALDSTVAGQGREQLETGLVTAASLLLRDEEVVRGGGQVLSRSGDPELAAEMAWLVGYSLWRNGQIGAAIAVIEGALARLDSGPQTPRLRALHAMIRANSGQADRATEVTGEALAGAERSCDWFAELYALYALCGIGLLCRNHEYMLDHIDRALGVIGDDPRTTDLRLLLLANKADALGDLGRHVEAITTVQQALVLAQQAGTPRLGMFRLAVAVEHYRVGRWDEALAELELTISFRTPDELRLTAHGLIALIAGHRDDRVTSARHLAAAAGIPIDCLGWENTPPLLLLLARALAAEQAGKPDEAVDVLAQCLDPAISEQMPGRHVLLPVLTRLALAGDDADTAAVAVAAAEQEAEREPLPVKTAAADHCRGLLGGDPAPILAAAEYFESAGKPLDRAQALEETAVLLASRCDLAAAREAFSKAAGLYRALGAAWDLRRADARLRRYGIRRGGNGQRVKALRGWEALTPTETEIANLVADGRSNPEIASALRVSRNTVGTHVSHILAKLGARSRAEIVRQALERQLTA